MTGPEHYTAAERLAVDAQSIESAIHAAGGAATTLGEALASQHARITARGQLHASLAIAAATAEAWCPTAQFQAWREVIR